MIHELQPKYQFSGRKVFSRKIIPNLYNKVYEQIRKEILSADFQSIFFTLVGNSSFISLTTHYVSKNFELTDLVLETK